VLFAAAAGWQLFMGSIPPPGSLPEAGTLPVPEPPEGWKQIRDEPITMWKKTAGRSVTYKAPDGSTLMLTRQLGWPDRRDHLPGFIPHECFYTSEGWDFDERSGSQEVRPGLHVRRIRVRRPVTKPAGEDGGHPKDVRYTELSAYACRDRLVPTWQEYKATLIWQRVLRQRRMWNLVFVTARPDTVAAAAAPTLLLDALDLTGIDPDAPESRPDSGRLWLASAR
jgi:hypothetical protein